MSKYNSKDSYKKIQAARELARDYWRCAALIGSTALVATAKILSDGFGLEDLINFSSSGPFLSPLATTLWGGVGLASGLALRESGLADEELSELEKSGNLYARKDWKTERSYESQEPQTNLDIYNIPADKGVNAVAHRKYMRPTA